MGITTGRLRLNIDHQFLDQPKTTFESEDGPVVFQANLGSYWAELNAGFTRQMGHASTFYGDLGYQHNFDGETHAWTARLGVRFNW